MRHDVAAKRKSPRSQHRGHSWKRTIKPNHVDSTGSLRVAASSDYRRSANLGQFSWVHLHAQVQALWSPAIRRNVTRARFRAGLFKAGEGMNRAERRAVSRENQRWLRALWASDAPIEAKQLGSELVAIAAPDGRVTLPVQGAVTFALTIPTHRATVTIR